MTVGTSALIATTINFLTPESEVLEIGCGIGSTALAHVA